MSQQVVFVVLLILSVGFGHSQSLNNLVDNRRSGCMTDVVRYLPSSKPFDTVRTASLGDNYVLWDVGETLLVKFMPSGSQELRSMVQRFASEWEQFANLKIKFLPNENTGISNIRIQLGTGMGHQSALGMQANQIPQHEPTMHFDTLALVDMDFYKNDIQSNGPVVTMLKNKGLNLSQVKTFTAYFNIVAQYQPLKYSEKEVRRAVQHQFGHVIGLLHEQIYPGAIPWNKSDSVYNYYNRTRGWDRSRVDFNLFEGCYQMYTNGAAFDPKSIMRYSVEPWQTLNGYSLGRNYELSEGDKKIMAAIYPKEERLQGREKAKVTIRKLAETMVTADFKRKGVLVYPSFEIKVNSNMAELYFVAPLYYKKGEDFLAAKALGNENNVFGNVGAVTVVRLLPNTTISYNKGSNKNLELFIPFTAIPDVGGKPLIATFNVFLVDTQNGNMTREMYNSVSNQLSLPKK